MTFRDAAGIETGPNDSRTMEPYLEGPTDEHRDVGTAVVSHWRLVSAGPHNLIRGVDLP